MFQLGFLVFRYLVVDEPHLQFSVNQEEDGEKDEKEQERLPGEGMLANEIEDLVEDLFY